MCMLAVFRLRRYYSHNSLADFGSGSSTVRIQTGQVTAGPNRRSSVHKVFFVNKVFIFSVFFECVKDEAYLNNLKKDAVAFFFSNGLNSHHRSIYSYYKAIVHSGRTGVITIQLRPRPDRVGDILI